MKNFVFSMPSNVWGRTKRPTEPKQYVSVQAPNEKEARRRVAFNMGRGKCPAGIQLLNLIQL